MFEPQLCANGGTTLPRGPRWILQPKLDGWRAIAVVGIDGGTLWTRAGNLIGSVPYITDQIARLPEGTILDGEIMANDFNDTQSLASRIKADRTKSVSFYAFDVLMAPIEDGRIWDFMNEPLYKRLAKLEELFETVLDSDACPNVRRVAQAPCTDEALTAMLAVGFEGGVAKHLDGRYRPGKRSHDTLKYKPQHTIDVVVTGTYEASPGSKYEGRAVGGLLVDHDGVELRVGTGMNDNQREAWFRDPAVIVGQLVEVGFNAGATERGGKGKKRHPSLKRIRHPLDKPADVVGPKERAASEESSGLSKRPGSEPVGPSAQNGPAAPAAIGTESLKTVERAAVDESSEVMERAVGHETSVKAERPTPRRRTVENRMRNYRQMRDEKLLGCLADLEAGEGPAYDKCVHGGSGDPQRDLATVRAIVAERGLKVPA